MRLVTRQRIRAHSQYQKNGNLQFVHRNATGVHRIEVGIEMECETSPRSPLGHTPRPEKARRLKCFHRFVIISWNTGQRCTVKTTD